MMANLKPDCFRPARLLNAAVSDQSWPQEFQITLLLERPGQVFEPYSVADHVWGHGIYVEDRTIDVHLSRLHKALSSSGAGSRPD